MTTLRRPSAVSTLFVAFYRAMQEESGQGLLTAQLRSVLSEEGKEVVVLRSRVYELEDTVRELEAQLQDEQRKRHSLELSYNNLKC